MIIKLIRAIYLHVIAFQLLFFTGIHIGSANPLDRIQLSTLDNQAIKLFNDDPVGITTRPLRKTKERWDQGYYKDFLQFRKIDINLIGKEIKGQFEVSGDQTRLTIYQISRPLGAEDMSLRVISTGFYHENEMAMFETRIEEMRNNVFIITGERVNSASELNSHLKYMNQQNNTIALSGYGTNWSLSKLKLTLTGDIEQTGGDSFVKDADWLVGQLINPHWVVFIRADKNE